MSERLHSLGRRALVCVPVVLLAATSLGMPADAARAQEPAAAAYEVPVPAYVADAAAELKREFVMGVARQAVSMAESSATEEVQLLVDAAEDMAAAAQRIRNTMNTIGSIDSSFGVPGISRLVTADGAVRDTLFGFVLWHESASGESRQIATDLEAAVMRMLALGEAAKSNARMLSSNAEEVKAALAAEDYAAIASSSGIVTEATTELELIAGMEEDVSSKIEEVVWKIQDGNGSLLDNEWQQVLLAVSETRRLASRIRPALESLRAGSGASEALSAALQGMVESISVMESAPRDESGSARYPSSLFDLDVDVVTGLEGSVTGGDSAMFAADSATAIEWLISKIVAADRALAERAVEYTSTEVGRAMDRLEDHYKRTSGFDESARGNDLEQAYEAVDRSMRANASLEQARSSARAARAALGEAASLEARGTGSWGASLSHCRDAWAHAVSAGEAARKSQNAVSGG